jgi:hypothetical protein
MVETNKKNLLEVAVLGKIVHPVVESLYITSWEGKPMIGLGRGGIKYNVKIGDPCFGWAWGEKVEPGVSADGMGGDEDKGSFRIFSCIGNTVKIISGDAKGDKGIVIGKVHHGHHITIHFNDETLEKLTIGDKVQVKAHGVGLKLSNFENFKVMNVSPSLLELIISKEVNSQIVVPVTKLIPATFVGQGGGDSPSESNNWDIQTQSPDAISELKNLRIGDIVLLEDIQSTYGRGYFEDSVTVGIVSCGASYRLGQGIGITVVLSGTKMELKHEINPQANIGQYLGLRRG